ncbi:hypothetical protein V6N13_076486 [Hibiscus sabdariffa]|uniref:CBS domain-containing protein n=2 Tax=Hibiscus sabdariffa TaxID=183260 RepID=A0ABR2AVC0_9ROSI
MNVKENVVVNSTSLKATRSMRTTTAPEVLHPIEVIASPPTEIERVATRMKARDLYVVFLGIERERKLIVPFGGKGKIAHKVEVSTLATIEISLMDQSMSNLSWTFKMIQSSLPHTTLAQRRHEEQYMALLLFRV